MSQMRRTMWLAMAGLLAGVILAQAFPGWMGVYGTTPRHNGVNPGQFRIMMNEDHFGLEASVGVRVNGGDWQEFAMTYQTNLDGNSVWAYTPPEPYPFGAEIDFYFHGYEGASNLYDSANGGNYHGGPLFWSEPRDTGLISAYPGNTYGKTRICSLGGDLIGAHASGVLTLARKPAGCEWEPLAYPLDDTGIADFGIAGNEGGLIVACMTASNLAVRTSADRGDVFSASLPLAAAPENASLFGLSIAAGAPGEFGIVYGVETNCCGAQQLFFTRSTNGGAAWSAPVLAMGSGDPGTFFSWFELGRNGDGWFLAARDVWGSSLLIYCAQSTNGTDWTTTPLGGNRAWSEPDLCLSSHTAVLAADPYYEAYTRVWRHQAGGWSTQDVSRTLESGRSVRLSADGSGRWYLFRQVDNNAGWLWSWLLSQDNGQTWTTNRALPNPAAMNPANDTFTLEQALNVGPKQYLLWHADYYVGTYQRMHEALLQKSDGYDERVGDLLWEGSTFTVVITNVAAGATNHLEGSAGIGDPVWTNLYTWRGDVPVTNRTGTAGAQGYFRIRVDR